MSFLTSAKNDSSDFCDSYFIDFPYSFTTYVCSFIEYMRSLKLPSRSGFLFNVLGLAIPAHFLCEIHCNAFNLLIFLKGQDTKYTRLESYVVSVTALLTSSAIVL